MPVFWFGRSGLPTFKPDAYHVGVQVGCELEFYLLKAPDKWSGTAPEPLDDSKYCQSSSADAAAEGD